MGFAELPAAACLTCLNCLRTLKLLHTCTKCYTVHNKKNVVFTISLHVVFREKKFVANDSSMWLMKIQHD